MQKGWFRMRRTISIFLLLMVFVSTSIVAFAAEDISTVSTDMKTVGNIENELNNYFKSNYPEMTIGSEEYILFLTEQLMFDSDIDLANHNQYNEFLFYASYYLSTINNPYLTEVTLLEDGTELTKLKPEIKEKNVDVIKKEVSAQDKKNELSGMEFRNYRAMPMAATYSTNDAVAYAKAHAESTSYNTPTYKSYSADCTNFVSQCINAGGKSMTKPSNYKDLGTYSTTAYWYHMHWTSISPYHRYGISTSFINVGDFYTYWKDKDNYANTTLTRAQLQNSAQKGDIVQLGNSGGWYHSIIITGGTKGDLKYCAHSRDTKDGLVSDISDTAQKFRIIRIN